MHRRVGLPEETVIQGLDLHALANANTQEREREALALTRRGAPSRPLTALAAAVQRALRAARAPFVGRMVARNTGPLASLRRRRQERTSERC